MLVAKINTGSWWKHETIKINSLMISVTVGWLCIRQGIVTAAFCDCFKASQFLINSFLAYDKLFMAWVDYAGIILSIIGAEKYKA